MIIGLWHPGSGVGDQLFCYLAAHITAERLGVDFAMAGEFKGKEFINLRYSPTIDPYHVEMPAGKIIMESDMPIYEGKTYYDPEFNFIEDNTIVDGCRVQDERYWEAFPVADWLRTEPMAVPDDVCVIGFRGGEYSMVPDLFLPQSYWDEAVALMYERGIKKFQVHTDDPATARRFFPGFECVHNVGLNWRSVRYAKHAIIANSAFYIIPRWLQHYDDSFEDEGAITIAPRYWARRNIKEWSTPQSYYPAFKYI